VTQLLQETLRTRRSYSIAIQTVYIILSIQQSHSLTQRTVSLPVLPLLSPSQLPLPSARDNHTNHLKPSLQPCRSRLDTSTSNAHTRLCFLNHVYSPFSVLLLPVTRHTIAHCSKDERDIESALWPPLGTADNVTGLPCCAVCTRNCDFGTRCVWYSLRRIHRAGLLVGNRTSPAPTHCIFY
jgi:hypothetical protein